MSAKPATEGIVQSMQLEISRDAYLSYPVRELWVMQAPGDLAGSFFLTWAAVPAHRGSVRGATRHPAVTLKLFLFSVIQFLAHKEGLVSILSDVSDYP